MTTNEQELKSLMTAGLDGDGAAYRRLLERLSPHLRSYYRGRLARAGRGASEAEDLLQEALLAIHTRRHTYDQAELFTPWMYAIARYKLIDYLRRINASRGDLPIENVDDLTARADHDGVESSIDLRRLMTRLPAKMQRAIQYVKLDGLSVAEAAHRSGMTESAVKISIHRGLKAMTAAIKAEDKS
ncbi:MAG: sigma-70 family RNA polymerase sigma factor [Reyranella sp.]|uniref:sigma-70 family RNA polymerase sigma factor n=1 Tax=Reyranella sp. TaxID=1929291 RepID=UPI001AC22E00|nr:sigma-70 family RNA polymerase sigma factor [Reyranella sp.]MBN9088057.1 sigma-70 family RNA polymerase sigma factor [Reyranella sp.]